MSNEVNTTLLERAAETIDLASEHIEYWAGTTQGRILELNVEFVKRDLDHNNLDNLYTVSLPQLDEKIMESSKAMFDNEYEPDENYITEDKVESAIFYYKAKREDGEL